MMHVNETYCGHHFTMYVNQTIMPYILNLHSDIHQLFLIKIRNKLKNKNK